ncbi:10199_t:CDS:2 [Paraglomus brasilianum]|uniref:10199_t:CDS:1 n=1 Tax=Paraglomus brasilianum TaxID=144538 RepID=A0A9N8VPH0_9GLOM|nr:10199_t:CDS:2 [Paraglomus brasilianum]
MDKCPYLLERWSSIEGNPTHTEFASGTPSTEPTEIHISRSTQSPIHMKLCPYISLLSAEKRARLSHSSPLQKTIFSFLFPGSPKVNSLLATFYISSIPNFILFFVPPDIQPPSLNTLVSFAVGGLLGDVFLHLLPQSFMGETSDDDVHFVMIDEKRNVVIGTVERKSVKETGESTAINKISNDAKRRNTSQSSDSTYDSTSSLSSSSPSSTSSSSSVPPSSSSPKSPSKQPSTSIRLSAYLNLIADATHNFTDGLAMAASFYASPSVGATTTVAVFFHEIPHEIGDYAILVQSGFTKRYALLSQFGTALGAFLGTFAGIAIEEYSRGDHPAGEKGFNVGDVGDGIWGTSVHMSDLVIPFTAGGFIYIATVGVIPELLEVSGKFGKDIKQGITEFVAMLIGIGMMAVIAWNED